MNKINKNKEFATYSKHYFDYPQGHIYLNKGGACTITLEGACSMKQEELDNYAKIMTKALNENNLLNKTK